MKSLFYYALYTAIATISLSLDITAFDIVRAIVVSAGVIGLAAFVFTAYIVAVGPPLEKIDEPLPGANSAPENYNNNGNQL